MGRTLSHNTKSVCLISQPAQRSMQIQSVCGYIPDAYTDAGACIQAWHLWQLLTHLHRTHNSWQDWPHRWESVQIWSYEKIFVTLSNARWQGEPSDTFILYRPDLERWFLTERCLIVLQTYLQDRMVHPRQPEIGGKTRQSANNPP